MAQLQPYPPIAVIGVLPKFFEYRGITIAHRERAGAAAPAGAPAYPTSDGIISNMGQFHYERIDGRLNQPRGARDLVVTLFLSSTGKYSQNGPALRSLLSGIDNERAVKEGRLAELFIFAEDEFFGKKNLTDILHEFAAGSARGVDSEGRASYFSAYPYGILALVVPEHQSVPRHTIMTAKAAQELLETEMLKSSSLPKIQDNDPAVIWCSGREGQIVKVDRPSETVGGIVPYYHRIIRAKPW